MYAIIFSFFVFLAANCFSHPIKAVIFDCDGTLIDSERVHFLAWQHVLKENGYDLSEDYYIAHLTGVSDENAGKIVETLLGIDSADHLIKEKQEFYLHRQFEGIPPIAPTVAFLHALLREKEKLGLKIAVASACHKDEILLNLRILNIEHLFDAIVSGFDDVGEYEDPEGTNKPKPYVYMKAAKLLGLSPEECVAIEDSRTGVTAAVTAGCFTVAIPNHYTKHHNLSIAQVKLESLEDWNVSDFFDMVSNYLINTK